MIDDNILTTSTQSVLNPESSAQNSNPDKSDEKQKNTEVNYYSTFIMFLQGK
jgi:hypothetical protein